MFLDYNKSDKLNEFMDKVMQTKHPKMESLNLNFGYF